MAKIRVRPMRAEDVDRALDIEREAFPTQWPPTPFRRELHNRLAHYLVVVEEEGGDHLTSPPPDRQASWLSRLLRREPPARVNGGDAGRVVGLVGFWLLYDEAHITTIAVKEGCRRQGLGELLMAATLESAQALHARIVTLEVRVSNFTAQALYEKYGFQRTGARRGYYTDNNEDALIMSTDPLDATPFQARYQRLKQALAHRLGVTNPPPGWPLNQKPATGG